MITEEDVDEEREASPAELKQTEDELLDEDFEEGLEEDEDDDEDEAEPEEGVLPSDNTDELNELEAEELEQLEDEMSETLADSEVEELKAIRLEEMTMRSETESQREDEFVCTRCFLVKRKNQLASRKNKTCTDCA